MANHPVPQDLPELIQQYIKNLAQRIRNRHMRRDVISELSAHFTDALADAPEDCDRDELAASLIADFGDTKIIARLIKRAKKRCYPTWLKVVGYTCRTIIIVFLISFAYTTWFLRGKSTVTVDYVAKFNEAIRPLADESSNAAPHYLKAMKLYVKPEGWKDFLKFQKLLGFMIEPQEHQALIKWLQANRPALQELRLGTAKPHCWFKYDVPPRVERRMRSIRAPLSVLNSNHLYPISVVLYWEMQFAAEQGDWNSFAADLRSTKTLARHLMQCPMLIEQNEGIEVDKGAYRKLIQVLRRYSLPPSALQRLAQTLDESFPSGYPIAESLEIFGLLDAAQRLFTDDGSGDGHFIPSAAWWAAPPGTLDNPPSYYYASADDPYFVARAMIHPSRRQTVKLINQWKQRSEKDLSMTPYQHHISGQAADTWTLKIIEENPRNLFIRRMLPHTRRTAWRSYVGRARHDAARTIVALLRYKADHSQFPDSLDKLVPEYIKAVSLDPFGPGPLTYRRQDDDFILYSLGLDFKDNAGQFDPRALYMREADGDYVFWPPEPVERPN